MKLHKYTIASDPISTEYFINAFHRFVCLYVYVARQRLGRNLTAGTNIHAVTEELLDASFCMQSVLYQSKVGS
jgi:hypothetical protein